MGDENTPTQSQRETIKERRMFKRDDRAQTPIQQIAIGGILVGISFVIALTMLDPIQTAVDDAKNSTDDTAVEAVLDLLPLLFVVGLAAGGVVFLVQGFKGLSGR